MIDGLVFYLIPNIKNCLFIGILTGLAIGLIINFNKNIRTEDIRQTDLANLFSFPIFKKVIKNTIKRAMQITVVLGLPLGLFSSLVESIVHKSVESFVLMLIATLAISYVLGFVMGFVENLYQATTTISFFKTIKTPYKRIKSGWLSYFFQAFFVLVAFLFVFSSTEIIQDDSKLLIGLFLLFMFPMILLLLIRMPLIQHCILRIALNLEKKAPLQYVKFLNTTTKARILERDGGHWRFRHQLIQDYFAQRYEKD